MSVFLPDVFTAVLGKSILEEKGRFTDIEKKAEMPVCKDLGGFYQPKCTLSIKLI